MKIAYVHALPLEYYPPATNLLDLMNARDSWQVRAWTTANRRGMPAWRHERMDVTRFAHPSSSVPLPLRLQGYLSWHFRTAASIARWKADTVISVEPHSALAVWLYYRIFRGTAALFIHHHEYYSPADFMQPGMRLLRATFRAERDDLFARAQWVSQTNEDRVRLLMQWSPAIRHGAAKAMPNYPPEKWVRKANAAMRPSRMTKHLRLVYLGSASFEDAFIREIATWAAERPEIATLHVCGNNVKPEVWGWLRSLGAANISIDERGVAYEDLPRFLTDFDVGLVLYKGNTLNFVHNVPNKAIEYLACGLEVWYPTPMKSMGEFHRRFNHLRMREVDFARMPAFELTPLTHAESTSEFPFTAEAATAPLMTALERVSARAEE